MKTSSFSIHYLKSSDIPIIVQAFAHSNWVEKPRSIFEHYLNEQEKEQRLIWVAYYENQFAGYVSLKWESLYQPFAAAHIPEIMDLNVLPAFRRIGLGSELLEIAENKAATKNKFCGIGVGLYAGADGGYGAAQRLYVNRGYVPDGRGVTYAYQSLEPGINLILDDDLVLWFVKKLGH